jgi:uncharacterized protein involved in type VI secretion and phage assembly
MYNLTKKSEMTVQFEVYLSEYCEDFNKFINLSAKEQVNTVLKNTNFFNWSKLTRTDKENYIFDLVNAGTTLQCTDLDEDNNEILYNIKLINNKIFLEEV